MRFTVPWGDIVILAIPFVLVLLTFLFVGHLTPIGAVWLLAWASWFGLRVGYRKGIEYATDEMRDTLKANR